MNSKPNLQDQLRLALALHMEETFEFGYVGEKQEGINRGRMSGLGLLNNSLCFFQKHWKSCCWVVNWGLFSEWAALVLSCL